MVQQLVIARTNFIDGLSFECDIDRDQYILNYLDIGSVALRILKTFSYRKLEAFVPIEKDALKFAFTKSLEQGVDHHSSCFCRSNADKCSRVYAEAT